MEKAAECRSVKVYLTLRFKNGSRKYLDICIFSTKLLQAKLYMLIRLARRVGKGGGIVCILLYEYCCAAMLLFCMTLSGS